MMVAAWLTLKEPWLDVYKRQLVRSVGICRWNVSGGNGERYGTVVLCPP